MKSWGRELNIYAVPAFITLVLLVVETIFLMVFLPETRLQRSSGNHVIGKDNSANGDGILRPSGASVEDRVATLKMLRWQHFLFLGIFSGMEFTLTFLTFDCELIIPSPLTCVHGSCST